MDNTNAKKLRAEFGRDFMWGASVAMYQTDGCDNTQWARWELENASHLAKNYENNFKQVPQYKDFITEATKPENYVARDGIRHREFHEQDFDILKDLGFNAFRFSIEWARVEPEEGKFDENEIVFIRRYILALKERGITPTMSLFHFTLPTWFADLGGFKKHGNIKYFVRFCEYVLGELKDDIKWIFTINEPMVYTFCSYLSGEWPPAEKSFPTALKIGWNLATAHKKVYKVAKKINPKFKISVAQNTASVTLGDKKLLTKIGAWFGTFQRDNFFLNLTHKKMDFLGVNWYNSDTYYGMGVKNPNEKVNDLGWDMRPNEINLALERLWNKYHLPMLITENGLADASDDNRIWWLEESLASIAKAQKNGVKMLGYLHWSAFDNFEWDKGYWPRFGLIEVNRTDYKRKVRKSAEWYRDFIKEAK
jgi:beta-glucosidase